MPATRHRPLRTVSRSGVFSYHSAGHLEFGVLAAEAAEVVDLLALREEEMRRPEACPPVGLVAI